MFSRTTVSHRASHQTIILGLTAQDEFEFVLAAIAQNLRRLAKLVTKPSPPPVPA